MKALSDAAYKAKVHEKHGMKLWPIEEYKCSRTRIKHECRDGHVWSPKPNTILNGSGCPKCYVRPGGQPKSNATYRTEVRKKHGSVLWPIEEYVNAVTSIKHKCNCGYEWIAAPSNILSGHGCHKCCKTGAPSTSNAAYRGKVQEIHGNDLWPIEEYTHSQIRIKHKCRSGHVWSAVPNQILFGFGCPCLKCCPFGKSKVALKWLSREGEKRGIEIQHAGNGGEYKIPGTRFYADGYHAESKTVFEFYGDAIHGNPNLYASHEKVHPWRRELTAGELYSATKDREARLKSLGYNIVSMWENDFPQRRKQYA